MKIDREFLAPRTEQAAMSQTMASLRAEGFETVPEPRHLVDGRTVPFDLEARRGDERIFYEFRVLGVRKEGDVALNDLAEAADALGGRFRLVVVRPERSIDVEIEGLAEALSAKLESDPTEELGRLGHRVSVDSVDDMELRSVRVRHGGVVEVVGSGVVSVTQYASDEGEFVVAESAFPFEFDATLAPDGSIMDDPAPDFVLDLSSWYGDDADA